MGCTFLFTSRWAYNPGVYMWGMGSLRYLVTGADLGGGCRGCAPLPPPPEMTCGFIIQLVFCKKIEKKNYVVYWC